MDLVHTRPQVCSGTVWWIITGILPINCGCWEALIDLRELDFF